MIAASMPSPGRAGLTGKSVNSTPSLRERALAGATWIALGTLARQVLKFGSSLALTRLLFPEAFGLVATASLVSAAVEMCSDLGIRQAIVQHRQGGTRRYLDSAWTMRVLRGLLLAAIMAALALPFSGFFGEPILFPMTLVMSVGAVLRGLTSPAILLLDRNLELRRLTTLEVGADVIRVVGTITAALILASVWGLVIGGLIGELARLIGSYMIARYRPRLRWDPEAMGALFRFGRFILLSSVIGYGAARLGTVFVAKFLGMEQAGVYYIGGALAMMFGAFFTQVISRVVFPALSHRQDEPAVLRSNLAEVIRMIGIVALPLGAVVTINSHLIVNMFYDHRYDDAALALRWLGAAACIDLLAHAFNAPLMATGRAYFGTVGTAAKLGAVCLVAPALGNAFGVAGYAGAMALAAGAFLAVMTLACARYGHISLRTSGSALSLPVAFTAVLVCIHVVGGWRLSTSGQGMMSAVAGTTLLAGLWAWHWSSMRPFIPWLRCKVQTDTTR